MTYYHYCSTSTFFNIANGKSVRLSSLSASNDTQEGKTLSTIAARLCEHLSYDSFQATQLIESISAIESKMDCLGLCLSDDGDTLSQWRGYADDAAGVAIGFNSSLFEFLTEKAPSDFPMRLHRVIYDEDAQEELLHKRLDAISPILESGDLRMPAVRGSHNGSFGDLTGALSTQRRATIKLTLEIFKLTDILYATKNPAFREEQESRFICEMPRDYPICEYYPRGAKLVPFINLPFPIEVEAPFDRVVVGPRNPTPLNVIKAFLAKNGIWCPVVPSTATYR